MKSKEVEFVTFVIKAMVTKPTDVTVTRTVDELGVLLSVTTNKSDMARVIGKQGQTAKAIRHLLRIVGFNNNSRVTMKIVDDTLPK